MSDGFVPGERFDIGPAGRGALDGLTFAVKDLIDVEGRRTGGGNPDWLAAAPTASRHAAAVAALLAAGARCTGKTITDELAFSLEGANAHYGTPVNPRNPDALPGGSSSGSAVAVATGAVDFALGTDTGGSVRVPAAFCGIFGFRPSHGAVSLDSVLPFAPSYDTVGWFARRPAVLAAVGDILLPAADSAPITAIALVEDLLEAVDGDVAADLREAADRLANRAPVSLLGGVSIDTLATSYATIQGYEIRLALGPRLAALRPRFGMAIAERFAGAMEVTESAHAEAVEIRALVTARLATACPPGTALIVPSVSRRFLPRTMAPAELGEFYGLTLGLNSLAGHAGLPQVQLRPSRDDVSGPALLATRGSDRALLSLAAQLGSQRGEVA